MASGEPKRRPDVRDEEKVLSLLWKLVRMLGNEISNHRGNKFTANSDNIKKLEISMNSSNEDIRKLSTIVLSKIISNSSSDYLTNHNLPTNDGKIVLTQPKMIKNDNRGPYLKGLLFLKDSRMPNKRTPVMNPLFYYLTLDLENHVIEQFSTKFFLNFLKNQDFSTIPDPKTSIVWIEHTYSMNGQSTKTHFSKKLSEESLKEPKKKKLPVEIPKMLPISPMKKRIHSRNKSSIKKMSIEERLRERKKRSKVYNYGYVSEINPHQSPGLQIKQKKLNVSHLYKKSSRKGGSRSPEFRTRKFEGRFERRRLIRADSRKKNSSEGIKRKNRIYNPRRKSPKNIFVRRGGNYSIEKKMGSSFEFTVRNKSITTPKQFSVYEAQQRKGRVKYDETATNPAINQSLRLSSIEGQSPHNRGFFIGKRRKR